jgi:hypothetical protein
VYIDFGAKAQSTQFLHLPHNLGGGGQVGSSQMDLGSFAGEF